MSKKHKKLPSVNLTTLSEADQPPGEDFFVFSLVFDDPFHPTWELRQTTMGSWNQVIFAAKLIAAGSGQSSGKLFWYQGQKARDYLREGLQHESRYQQERKATPNN
jgi:hypothetical protein